MERIVGDRNSTSKLRLVYVCVIGRDLVVGGKNISGRLGIEHVNIIRNEFGKRIKLLPLESRK